MSRLGRGFWISYPVLGLFYLWLATDPQPGWYHGNFAGDAGVYRDRVTGHIDADATTPSRWYWLKPETTRFTSVRLVAELDVTTTIRIDLQSHRWTTSSEEGAVTEQFLAEWLLRNTSPADRSNVDDAAATLMRMLVAMREGTLRPSGHHMRDFEAPFKGRYHNLVMGTNAGAIILIGWLALGPLVLLLSWRSPKRPGRTPQFAFLLTVGVVGALDAIVIAIGMLMSPGPIAEAMEMAVALINLPIYLLLGDWGFDLFGLIVSAVFYGMLAAWIVMMRRDRALVDVTDSG